jgi:hypothetical protein
MVSFRSFVVGLLVVPSLLSVPIKADLVGGLVCGGLGATPFLSTNELTAAVQCYTQSTNCNSLSLPLLARTGLVGGLLGNLVGYYGSNITNWCTGSVTNFDGVFQGNTVSQEARSVACESEALISFINCFSCVSTAF